MTECPDCKNGIDYKNLGAHKLHCKAKKLQSSSDGSAGAILKDQKSTIISQKEPFDPSICTSPADDNYKKVFDLSKQLWWIQFKLNNIILLLLFIIITIGYIAVRYKV